MKKWTLFHRIGAGGEDSAIVRKYVVDHKLGDHIEFLNVAYEGAQKTLRERLGNVEAPVLFAGDQILRGSQQILEFFRANA